MYALLLLFCCYFQQPLYPQEWEKGLNCCHCCSFISLKGSIWTHALWPTWRWFLQIAVFSPNQANSLSRVTPCDTVVLWVSSLTSKIKPLSFTRDLSLLLFALLFIFKSRLGQLIAFHASKCSPRFYLAEILTSGSKPLGSPAVQSLCILF